MPFEVQIRPLQREDLSQSLRIERACFSDPWQQPQFMAALQTDGASMLVAVHSGIVVGHIVMRVWAHHVEIWTIAIEPENQRRGIGTLLVGKAKARLMADCREVIKVDVRENDLPAQLFFRAMGFKAQGIEKGTAIADPAIHFEYALRATGDEVLKNLLEGDGHTLGANK